MCNLSLAADFVAVTEDVTFIPGGEPNYCFDVRVLPDKAVERTESFFLLISSNSNGVLTEPSSAKFTITDEDGKC